MNDRTSLIRAVMAYDIDQGPASLSFAQRLARENLWPQSYAERVVVEYKRFVLLAMLAGHEVTPSEQVDQAWHLHLTYTKSYWEGLRPLLPRPLHHNPTKGGPREDQRFEDQYLRTLNDYRSLFGEAPPPDIWPPAEQRFGHDPAWARVNLRDSWVVPKQATRKVLIQTGVWGALILLAGSGVAWASQSSAGAPASPTLKGVVIFAAVLAIVLGLIALAARHSRGQGQSSGCSSGAGCSAITSGCGSSHPDSNDSSGCGSSGCSSSGCGSSGCGGGGD